MNKSISEMNLDELREIFFGLSWNEMAFIIRDREREIEALQAAVKLLRENED